MLTPIDDRVLSAVAKLNNNDDFKVFIEYLKLEKINLVLKSIVRKDDVECRWVQGAAQVVGELIVEIEVARNRFNMLQNKQNKGKMI